MAPSHRDTASESSGSERLTQLDRIERKIDHLDKTIRGDGEKIGHSGRLDRLEQESKRRSVFTMAAIGAGTTAIIGSAWAIITGGKVTP